MKYIHLHYNTEADVWEGGKCQLEFLDVKEWLEWHANNLKERNRMERLNAKIGTVPAGNHVQLYECIDIVADMMGLDLTEDDKNEEYYRYHFLYNGVEFMQLSDRRLGKYAGKD